MEGLLSIPQAAKRLGMTEAFVRRAVLLKRIEYVKVGRLVRFKPETIDAYIEANTVKEMENK